MTAYSKCEACSAEMGVKMEFPIYCVSCIEEMERLNLSVAKFRKHRQSSASLP